MKIADIFAQNLRGKEYIVARGLSPQVIAEQRHVCKTCAQLAMLPAVQRLTKQGG